MERLPGHRYDPAGLDEAARGGNCQASGWNTPHRHRICLVAHRLKGLARRIARTTPSWMGKELVGGLPDRSVMTAHLRLHADLLEAQRNKAPVSVMTEDISKMFDHTQASQAIAELRRNGAPESTCR